MNDDYTELIWSFVDNPDIFKSFGKSIKDTRVEILFNICLVYNGVRPATLQFPDDMTKFSEDVDSILALLPDKKLFMVHTAGRAFIFNAESKISEADVKAAFDDKEDDNKIGDFLGMKCKGDLKQYNRLPIHYSFTIFLKLNEFEYYNVYAEVCPELDVQYFTLKNETFNAVAKKLGLETFYIIDIKIRHPDKSADTYTFKFENVVHFSKK